MRTLVPIPPERLPGMVGKPIHLRDAPWGCVWILDRIDGNTLHMHTPKTKRPMRGRADMACYVRRYEPASPPDPTHA